MTGSAGETPRRKRRAPARPKQPVDGAPHAQEGPSDRAADRPGARRGRAPRPPRPKSARGRVRPADVVDDDRAGPWRAIDPIAQWDEQGAVEPVEESERPAARRRHRPPTRRPPPAPPETLHARLATPEELADWDTHTVASLNGHVYQSLAWGDYRAAHGRPVWHLVFDDGFRMLVVGRDRPVVGGGWAYATPRPDPGGPRGHDRDARRGCRRAARGGGRGLVHGGRRVARRVGPRAAPARRAASTPVEEVQASRHRMDVQLGPEDAPNSDEKTIFGSFGATTRNNIRQAERHGLRVMRLDAGGGRAEDEYDSPGTLEGLEPVGLEDARAHRSGCSGCST